MFKTTLTRYKEAKTPKGKLRHLLTTVVVNGKEYQIYKDKNNKKFIRKDGVDTSLLILVKVLGELLIRVYTRTKEKGHRGSVYLESFRVALSS